MYVTFGIFYYDGTCSCPCDEEESCGFTGTCSCPCDEEEPSGFTAHGSTGGVGSGGISSATESLS